jgi:hypothetical protein
MRAYKMSSSSHRAASMAVWTLQRHGVVSVVISPWGTILGRAVTDDFGDVWAVSGSNPYPMYREIP